MKYILFVLPFLGMVSCKKEKNEPITEVRTSSKSVDFLVYTLQDFSDPRFDDLYVSIDLAVRKINRKNNSLIASLWDTTLQERPIREYPYTEPRAVKITKQFSGIKDSVEKVNIYYSISSRRGNGQPAYSTLVTPFDTGNRKRIIKVVP